MDGSAIKEIRHLIEDSQLVELEGKKYSTRKLMEVEPDTKRPSAVGVNTLRSLVDFVINEGINPKEPGADDYFAVISESLDVSVYSGFQMAQDKLKTIFNPARLTSSYLQKYSTSCCRPGLCTKRGKQKTSLQT